jgi:hypothetical protein
MANQYIFVGLGHKEANGPLKQICNRPGKPMRAKITADMARELANENLLSRECNRKDPMAASVHSLGSKLSNTYSIINEDRNSRRKLAQKRPKATRKRTARTWVVLTFVCVIRVLRH